MESHVSSRAEAERILYAFPPESLEDLCAIAEIARLNEEESPLLRRKVETTRLPYGWAAAMGGNCIIIRYEDGKQERQAFHVPEICIEFRYMDPDADQNKVCIKKSVIERHPLGVCTCGKPIPFAQMIL